MRTVRSKFVRTPMPKSLRGLVVPLAVLLAPVVLMATPISPAQAAAAPTSSQQTLQTNQTHESLPKTGLNPAFDGDWRILLQARDSRDDFNQKSIVILRGDLNFNYHLATWMNLNISPSATGVSGHAQTEIASEANGSTLKIRNATADFLFLENSRFQMGIANQKAIHSALLVDDRGFPAARIQLRSLPKSYFLWEGFAQSAVPTSSSLTTNTKEFEPTPSFNSGGILLGLNTGSIRWRNQLAFFEYHNLPSNVATESGLLGNTVTITNSTDAQFTYGHKGLEAQIDLEADLSPRWLINLRAALTKNSEAPAEHDQGVLGHLGTQYLYSSNLAISPFFQAFRIEPDTVVALYNRDYLNTNRIGYRSGLTLTLNKRFSISASGGERGLIFENPAQSHEHFVDISLETLNAKF